MSKATFDAIFDRYTKAVTAGDVDGILSIYAPEPSVEIPVGGPLHDGMEAVERFYRDNELAERLAIAGTACVAGREAAIPLTAWVRQGDTLLEVDVIDVAKIDEAGRVLSMRAFFDLEGARTVDEG